MKFHDKLLGKTGLKIKILSVFFLLFSTYFIYINWGVISYTVKNDGSFLNLGVIIHVIILFLPLVGCFFLWKMNRLGWIMLMCFQVYFVICSIVSLYFICYGFSSLLQTDEFWSLYNPFIQILFILLFGILIYYFQKKEIRKLFQIKDMYLYFALCVGTILAVLILKYG